MWCTTSSSTCSSSGPRNSSARSGSSAARSKPRRAAARTASSSSGETGSSIRTASASTTSCRGRPSVSGNRVRSASWRTTTSRTAARSAATSSAPVRRMATGMLYAGLSASSWPRNHSRRWAGESGSTSGRTAGAGAGRASPASATRAARAAGVGASKTARTGRSAPSAVLIRPVSRVASSECPPRSKNESSGPAGAGRPRTSPNTSHSNCSCGVRGARAAVRGPCSGAGSSLRSTLPLAVSGSASIATYRAGTMCAGRLSARCARSTAGAAVPTVYATSCVPPGRSSRATTVAWDTPGWAASTDSISPSSIRKPRILTWWSARPMYSICPSAPQRTTSPVRYIRLPGGPNGSGTKRVAVSAGRPW